MGLFRKIGREVGQFTSEAKAVAEEHANTDCAECDARYSTIHEECPECGAATVVADDVDAAADAENPEGAEDTADVASDDAAAGASDKSADVPSGDESTGSTDESPTTQ
ncbi:zinc ribbon domain-containing protein [Haloarchaeobius sp. DFWS5]|uniref:zinc ribbon domain-containing protein n=1 Tax=Haloarchaeobius sp. DFWS5 TaxID=3446114 RepID=UPI003EBB5A6B